MSRPPASLPPRTGASPTSQPPASDTEDNSEDEFPLLVPPVQVLRSPDDQEHDHHHDAGDREPDKGVEVDHVTSPSLVSASLPAAEDKPNTQYNTETEDHFFSALSSSEYKTRYSKTPSGLVNQLRTSVYHFFAYRPTVISAYSYRILSKPR